MATETVQEKAGIYCRFTYEKAYELIGAPGESKELRDFGREGNIRSCIGRILIGYQQLPSDDDFKEKADGALKRIAEIDEKLARKQQGPAQ